jgi:NTE family protein
MKVGVAVGLAGLLVGQHCHAQPASGGTDVATARFLPAAVVAPTARPRIGLVLGGGGAKGAAHVGVLAVLDELHIPVDCVVGTSMGALVGGAFASGQTADEIDASIRKISWADTIAFRGYREKLPMRRKLAGVTYTNPLEFGVTGQGVSVPHGFINTQNIEQAIKSLVKRSPGESDFDRLPIPFRAIATDMLSGEMVVLSKGDLAQSMRASMAVPGVFAPVELDGRILGDGGLTRNLPVDVARQTCADVVIAVAVPNPPPKPADLLSPLTMLSRTLDITIGVNEKQQLDSLGPADVTIIVPMGDVGSSSFDKIETAIPLGRTAAAEHRAELSRYSLPASDYAAWRLAHSRPEPGDVKLAAIRIEGLERINRQYVEASLGLKAGESVDPARLSKAMDRVFALDDFESVQYALRGDPATPTLEVQLKEKAAAPNIVRFDLGLSMGTDGNTAFSLGGDYLRPWINELGGEVHGHVQIGRLSSIGVSLYQPVDPPHRWFVEPGLYAGRSLEDIYDDGQAATRYQFDSAYGFLDFGTVFGSRAELRAGVLAGEQSATRDIAVRNWPELRSEAYRGVSFDFTYDDRDSAVLATHGSLARVRYYRSLESLGAPNDYDRIEALVARSVPILGNVLELRAMGGESFEGLLPLYDYFVLGGPESFPGLSIGQLRGQSYWAGSAMYLQKIADISETFGQSLYVGLKLSVGDVSSRLDGVRSAPIYSGAIVLGGRTPLGPVTLSLGAASTDDWQIVFGLGRPIEERNISDVAW